MNVFGAGRGESDGMQERANAVQEADRAELGAESLDEIEPWRVVGERVGFPPKGGCTRQKDDRVKGLFLRRDLCSYKEALNSRKPRFTFEPIAGTLVERWVRKSEGGGIGEDDRGSGCGGRGGLEVGSVCHVQGGKIVAEVIEVEVFRINDGNSQEFRVW